MSSSFNIGLSGLQANQTAIEVVGNNLANVNTNGYKASTVGFTDVLAMSANGAGSNLQVGAGVGVPQTVRYFVQGSLKQTGGYLDAAIQGNGFFVVKSAAGRTMFTRCGSFVLDKTGTLTTLTGEKVQSWTGTSLSNIMVSTDPLPPVKTANLNLKFNLNAGNPQPFTVPAQVYDSAGRAIDLSFQFKPSTDAAGNIISGQWGYEVTAGGSAAPILSGTLTFDLNGNLAAPSGPIGLSVPNQSGVTQNITWNLSTPSGSESTPSITQLALPSKLTTVEQDGSPTIEFVRAKITTGGTVVGEYTDGREIPIAQLATGGVINPDSLLAVGDNFLVPSANSGTMEIGLPGEKGRGMIMPGSVETSTVDVAGELTDLMTYQRGYQANSRVITTADELLQEALTLKR